MRLFSADQAAGSQHILALCRQLRGQSIQFIFEIEYVKTMFVRQYLIQSNMLDNRPTGPAHVDTIKSYFKEQQPILLRLNS